MSTKIVKVIGSASIDGQFVVESQNLKIRVGKNELYPELEGASPLEYILAGYAGCINAVGKIVAKEQEIILKSLKVEVVATLSLDKYQGKISDDRAGFSAIEVLVKPIATATTGQLVKWLNTVKERCPVHDTFLNATPIITVLSANFNGVESN